jgi:hypothetical protein
MWFTGQKARHHSRKHSTITIEWTKKGFLFFSLSLSLSLSLSDHTQGESERLSCAWGRGVAHESTSVMAGWTIRACDVWHELVGPSERAGEQGETGDPPPIIARCPAQPPSHREKQSVLGAFAYLVNPTRCLPGNVEGSSRAAARAVVHMRARVSCFCTTARLDGRVADLFRGPLSSSSLQHQPGESSCLISRAHGAGTTRYDIKRRRSGSGSGCGRRCARARTRARTHANTLEQQQP